MVWWIDNYETRHHLSGPHFGFHLIDERIFQTGNIMFDLCKKSYSVFEVNTLISTGVNIFNVDRTLYNMEVLQAIEQVIIEVDRRPLMYPEKYHRPTSLSVTMSVDDPVAITKRTDFVILKDVTEPNTVIEFRKLSEEYQSIPILLWLVKLEVEATNELIKISNGIILDIGNGIFDERYCSCIQKCYENSKPVFYSNSDLIDDYYGPTGNDRKLLIFANNLVENRLHGVVVKDSNDLNFAPTELVHSLVKAVHLAEMKVNVEKDFYRRTFDVKTPVLPPLAVAYAASRAALLCGASAILVLTVTGQSAKTFAFSSPTCHVIAITTREETARRMHLYRKVIPLVYDRERAHSWHAECRNRIGFGTAFALSARLLGFGAKLVVLAPSEEVSGYCDSFQIVSVPFCCNE